MEAAALDREVDVLVAELLRREDLMVEHLLRAGMLLAQLAPRAARQLLHDLEDVARRHPRARAPQRLRAAVAEKIGEGGAQPSTVAPG